jgi:hypothetical protein
LGRLTGISVIVVPGGDHDLGKRYICPLDLQEGYLKNKN